MYCEITLKVPDKNKLGELIEEFLYEHFPQGWETIEEKNIIIFKIYAKERAPEIDNLEKFLAKHLDVEVEYRLIKEENWAEVWKANFRPIKLGKNLVIIPPWEKYEPYFEEIVIIIEPAQAFGTGHHPTTQMMLENIENYTEKFGKGFLKILDLGCGTGILGIACAKLISNCKIWAVDIDEEAIKACKYNVKLNQMQEKFSIQKEIPEEMFDLILANIGYRELKNLASSIKKHSKKDRTHVFLTGILNEDAEKIENLYRNLGYQLVKKQSEKEWAFLWMKL